MSENHILLLAILHLSLTLTIDASLKISGHNQTVEVEKTKTSVLNRYKLGPEFEMKLKSADLTISCELFMSNSAELIKPIITVQKLGDATSKPTLTSEMSADKKTFRAKVTMTNAKDIKASAYVCQGEANGQTVSTVIAFHSVPLLSLSIEGVGYESADARQSYAKSGDLAAIHGTKISVTCEVHGYPTAAASWHRIELLDDSQKQVVPIGKGEKLEFTKVDYYKDRGQYFCRAENSRGQNTLNIYLRVKHPRAYLIPLVILSIQFLILLAIYIVYELSVYEKRWRAARRQEQERLEASGGVRGSTISNVGAGARRSATSARSSTLSSAAAATRSSNRSTSRISSSSAAAPLAAGANRQAGAKQAPKPSTVGKAQPGPSIRT